MNWLEITLNGEQPLCFKGKRVAVIKHRDATARNDVLALRFKTGVELELYGSIDLSEQIEDPRIFLIEGTVSDTFVIFGGENAYWLTIDGRVVKRQSMFRRSGEEEYWETQILLNHLEILVIYEAGVFALDAGLNVRCHKPKLLNDKFIGIKDEALLFVRDHATEWTMDLDDGKN